MDGGRLDSELLLHREEEDKGGLLKTPLGFREFAKFF